MKKSKFLLVLIVPFLNFNLTSCSKFVSLKNEIAPYIFETEKYTSLDYDYADKYFHDTYDDWGGCSAISTIDEDGHLIVGRNMDLNISNRCAYLVRTEAGAYKTFGLAYTFRDISPEYNEVKENNSIPEQFAKVLPFMCDDVINDQGLHVEINMRHAEYWPNGEDKFTCEHTNESSNKRIYLFELPRYLCENCKNVDEAIDFVKNTDIYSKNHYWSYCFLISDSQGKSGLLEFGMNKYYWMPDKKCQTNFYVNEECNSVEDIKSGEGRYNTLMGEISQVKNKEDMFNLMEKVSYSHYYEDYDTCKNNYFDPRSELIGEIAKLTYDYIMNPENEPLIRTALNDFTAEYRNLTRQERQNKNSYWESTFTEVVDVTEKTMFVRFFENDNLKFNIDFDGITEIN